MKSLSDTTVSSLGRFRATDHNAHHMLFAAAAPLDGAGPSEELIVFLRWNRVENCDGMGG